MQTQQEGAAKDAPHAALAGAREGQQRNVGTHGPVQAACRHTCRHNRRGQQRTHLMLHWQGRGKNSRGMWGPMVCCMAVRVAGELVGVDGVVEGV